MSVEENKAVIRRWFEASPKGDSATVRGLLAPNFVSYVGSSPPMRGFEAYEQFTAGFRNAFPDIQFTVDELIGEGDKVVARWTMRGTHQGNFQGIPPTGKKVAVSGMNISRLEGGKVVEDRAEMDALGMMQQLGVVPPPPGQGS
jgi:steroid delta-isomerase-like uncharacterized protein